MPLPNNKMVIPNGISVVYYRGNNHNAQFVLPNNGDSDDNRELTLVNSGNNIIQTNVYYTTLVGDQLKTVGKNKSIKIKNKNNTWYLIQS